MRALAIVVLLWLAGCVQPQPAAQTAPIVGEASVSGHVLDTEQRPVAGARVRLGPQELVAAEDGSFAFEHVAPGTHALTAQHVAYQPATLELVVEADQRLRKDILLSPLPRSAVFNETFPYHGDFDCASDALIVGGDCLVLYENLTGENDPITSEKNAFRLPVRASWTQVRLRMTWQNAAENQLEGMRLLLEHGNASNTGHGYSVAQVEGPQSPLELVVDVGVVHPSAEKYEGSESRAMIPREGEELQIRAFPRGRLTDVFGQVCDRGRCLLGLGVGLDIDFDVEAIVSYRT